MPIALPKPAKAYGEVIWKGVTRVKGRRETEFAEPALVGVGGILSFSGMFLTNDVKLELRTRESTGSNIQSSHLSNVDFVSP